MYCTVCSPVIQTTVRTANECKCNTLCFHFVGTPKLHIVLHMSLAVPLFICLIVLLSATSHGFGVNGPNRVPVIAGFPESTLRCVLRFSLSCAVSACLIVSQTVHAKPESVNKPKLLPREQTSVIDVANFLSKGQEKKLSKSIEQLERSTGFKLRVVCQRYPETPGAAVRDYWNVDDNTVVLVADRGEGFNRKGIPGNFINLNIGSHVETVLPNVFWNKLTGKLGNMQYVDKQGEDVAVINAVESVVYCLQEKTCQDIPFDV